MPEYLAPGVYVEETSFRAKSIEGVSTSTAAFIGPARFGPTSGEPELLTSRADFERIYGDSEDLSFSDQPPRPNFLWHAARAFFEEGGKRLYVVRVFNGGTDPIGSHAHADTSTFEPDGVAIAVRARFPGQAGNLRITFTLRVGANALVPPPSGSAAGTPLGLTRIQDYQLVFAGTPVAAYGDPRIASWTALHGDGLFLARRDPRTGEWSLRGNGDTVNLVAPVLAGLQIRPLSVLVEVQRPTIDTQGQSTFSSPELLGEFGFDPRSANGLTRVFDVNPPTRLQALTIPFAIEVPIDLEPDPEALPAALARELLGTSVVASLLEGRPDVAAMRRELALTGGADGALPLPNTYEGQPTGFHDYQALPLQLPKNGLLALESVDDISIVAAPGYSFDFAARASQVVAIQNAVINHCEQMRYRIAVLDTPPDQLVSGALDYRNQRSSKYAAMYYPWVTVANPADGTRLNLPPSGFVCGIYARNDVEHAVFKAPANEVVRLAIDFEQRLTRGQQEALNPNGINCFRFFEGRGYMVWGARTISDDPEWKYVNLRRYFAYLEHSIDRGTQWAVFENNSQQLWDNVRRTIEDFLFNEWKMGALMGSKPDQAFFVRCDLSTMTQNDLDNGRLVCQIGVAPVRPAEFVIFRIGQITASAPR